MIKDKNIYIKNIYYMLTYAFQILRHENFEKIQGEEFDTIQDLFATIIAKGVSQQLKQGLYREYQVKNESLVVLKGKLDLNQTIRNQIQRNRTLGCEYDELTEDNIYNRILKTTMLLLIKQPGVKIERKTSLRKVLVFFQNVSVYDISQIQWNSLHYHRTNKNYEMLMNLCYFVLEGMLQTNENGTYKMESFLDEHMPRLYERFILEYYKKEHKELSAGAYQVKWNLSREADRSMIHFLPIMKTDIMLQKDDKTLIIDAKYYTKTMQTNFDKTTLHSNNVYQIFTYVKNEDKDQTGNVSGLLLYAKTNEEVTPDCEFEIDGNRIGAKTLDLNTDFCDIKKQLETIVQTWL